LISLTLLGAFRPIPRLETAVQLSYSRHSVVAPGLSADSTGFGDSLVRARYELLDQPMPAWRSSLPAVAAALALRIPTGEDAGNGVTSGTSGAVGSSAASTTLGAWETALGVELVKSSDVEWEISSYGEAGYRFADESLGIERQLGPRVLGQLGLRFIPTPDVSAGTFAEVSWEEELKLARERVSGTAQRRVSAGLFVAWQLWPSGLRGGMQVRHTPLLDGLSANVLASTSLSVSLGIAR
jgi:hypothetical protein